MYTPNTSYFSPPVGTAQRWADALAAHGAKDAAVIAATYFAEGGTYGLNADLALAQGCQEAAWFTSQRWVAQRNPAGIGVTASAVAGPTFQSIQDGIRAHYQHLSCYVYTASTCPVEARGLAKLDPRHTFHAGHATVAGLEAGPKWAVPGDNYVAAICAIANQVTGGSAPVTEPWDRIHLSADYGPDRAIADIQWFVVHDTEGSFPGDEAVLTSAAAPVESATFLIGRAPEQGCVYIVPLDKTPWSCANQAVDTQGISVELSRNPRLGETGYTDYQYRKLAEVFRWCVAQGADIPAVYIGRDNMSDYGPEPDHRGIIGHQDVPDPNNGHLYGGEDHHTDPGPTFKWDYFISLIGNAPVDDVRTFPETGKTIRGNIKGYWERFGKDAAGIAVSTAIFGLAITDLVTENGLPTQYFERAVLEDHGSKGVMGRRLGADAAKAAGYSGPGIGRRGSRPPRRR